MKENKLNVELLTYKKTQKKTTFLLNQFYNNNLKLIIVNFRTVIFP